MEPITFTAATASFATIVGLVADFISHRKANEAQTLDAYIDWLRRHEHQAVIELLESNRELSAAIRTLLQNQHSEVLALLKEMDSRLVTVASQMNGLASIVVALDFRSLLSEQAVSVLRQLNDAKGTRIYETKLLSGKQYHVLEGTRADIQFSDPRFIEDDLLQLVELDLLRLDFSPKSGDRIFVITRLGAKLVDG